MAEPRDIQRHSRALDAELIPDPDQRAVAEARNGLRQFDRAVELIESWLQQPDRPFRLRLSAICIAWRWKGSAAMPETFGRRA